MLRPSPRQVIVTHHYPEELLVKFERKTHWDSVLEVRKFHHEGLELRQLRVKYPRDSFFAKGNRAALAVPQSLMHESAVDNLHSGRKKLRINFELPRGSYATIVIKRLTSAYMNRHKQ